MDKIAECEISREATSEEEIIFRGRNRNFWNNRRHHRNRSRLRDRQFSGNVRRDDRSSSRSRSGSRTSKNRWK